MEIKAILHKPYTEEQKIEFIVDQNHKKSFEIRETETEVQAWGYTQEERKEQERARKDAMILTSADVERALYKAKEMNFDDLIQMIEETSSGIDMKALKIEFKANLFYRGAKFGNNKLFDVVGGMLGYTAEDMDYLFENKELPESEEIND